VPPVVAEVPPVVTVTPPAARVPPVPAPPVVTGAPPVAAPPLDGEVPPVAAPPVGTGAPPVAAPPLDVEVPPVKAPLDADVPPVATPPVPLITVPPVPWLPPACVMTVDESVPLHAATPAATVRANSSSFTVPTDSFDERFIPIRYQRELKRAGRKFERIMFRAQLVKPSPMLLGSVLGSLLEDPRLTHARQGYRRKE
jgi:hypothetical protein